MLPLQAENTTQAPPFSAEPLSPTSIPEIEKTSEPEKPAPPPSDPPLVALRDFKNNPPIIQTLILRAFALHQQNLGYRFGSADPQQGGMDCSGTVSFLLRDLGWKNVPRQSDGFYRWAWQAETFRAVHASTWKSFEWAQLQPGDLLFWVGTYSVQKERDPAISHVMLYLGEEEGSGRKLMFGASEGRRYQGKSKNGVGLFDFYLPEADKTSPQRPRFIGYARIPGLETTVQQRQIPISPEP
jgi:peptidoglycan DL-endopeptidase CwlO